MTSYNINIVHIRNPNVVMWWSAAFPGFGHMLLCKYATAIMLILWEFVVNINAHLNLSILYTFLGDFDQAELVLNKRWLLLYIPPYIFGLWDTRRLVYDLNKAAVFAELAHSTIDRIKISPLEINQLAKRNPTTAAVWSSMMPGLGHLYINRLPDGFFLIIVWVTCCVCSNILGSLHLSFLGHFVEATQIVNPSWLLFLPSIYVFTIYDAYMNCVEVNREFHIEQRDYLKSSYQSKGFLAFSNLFTSGADSMNIIAAFEQTLTVELAILELQRKGVPKEGIFAIPLSDKEKPQNIQHMMNNNGFYMLNSSLCVGSATMTLGTIYGFIWPGGPILWGLIGFVAGCLIGLLFDIIAKSKKVKLIFKKNKGPDIFLVIHSEESQVQMIKEVLFNFNALALSEVRLDEENLIEI